MQIIEELEKKLYKHRFLTTVKYPDRIISRNGDQDDDQFVFLIYTNTTVKKFSDIEKSILLLSQHLSGDRKKQIVSEILLGTKVTA